MPLLISNTLTGRKEPFEPLDDPVRMYVCGMTPKDKPHAGHAFMFVHMDVIRRYLEHHGYAVRHIQNFTDIDDKILARAAGLGRDPFEYASEMTAAYFAVMDRLHVRRAHEFPTVSGNIENIIAAVRELVESEHAYPTSEGVYFAVDTFEDYGKLSGRTEADVEAGARVEVDEAKRNPRDFALWKFAKDGEISWDSPWGRGRPGWHIECSTMIRHTLGDQIDIHGGGADLIFPHHENEIAQAEAGTDRVPFVKHWAHTGLMLTGSEKMAHSLGNFTTVESLFEEFAPDVLRLYFLSVHYRSPLNFSREPLRQSAAGYDRMLGFMRALGRSEGGDPYADVQLAQRQRDADRDFHLAMDDDFNAPRALAALFDFGREINRLASAASAEAVGDAQAELTRLLAVLGVELVGPRRAPADADPYIDLLVDVRTELREAKLWESADRIRAALDDLGVVLEDSPDGTTWRRG